MGIKKQQKVIQISLVEKRNEDLESRDMNSDQSDTVGDVIMQSVTEYCENSGIVGLKYLGERKRPFFEK